MKYITLLLMSSCLCGAEGMPEFMAKGIYHPPFENGTWFVVQGGDTPNVNHHFAVPCQWYGVDIMLSKDRALNAGDGADLKDYYSYGQNVVSPCDGVVQAIGDGYKDNKIGESDAKNEYGNYVVIKSSESEYVVLAHFKNRSIVVKPNDVVKVGQKLGVVGNSGNATAPHIHMHVQNAKNVREGNGLLFEFSGAIGVISHREISNSPLPLIQGEWIRKK